MVSFVVDIVSSYTSWRYSDWTLLILTLWQPYKQPLGNCCSNDTLFCVSASGDVKDEPVKNPQAVKPQDDRSPTAQGTESLVGNVS